MREAPGRKRCYRSHGRRKHEQRIETHPIRQTTKSPLPHHLPQIHQRQQQRTLPPTEPNRRRIRRQKQRREKKPQPLRGIRGAIHRKQWFPYKRPIRSRRRTRLHGGRQSAPDHRDERARGDHHGDSDGTESGFVAVFGEEEFDDEGHCDARSAGGAGDEAECHAAAGDPPFVDDA